MMVFIELIVFLTQKLLYYQITTIITKKFHGPYILGAGDTAIKVVWS